MKAETTETIAEVMAANTGIMETTSTGNWKGHAIKSLITLGHHNGQRLAPAIG
jgi:hypothetical protein